MNYLHRFTVLSALIMFLFFASGNAGILAADDLIHMVGRGETIYSISRFYSVSADDLMKANNITDPSRLLAGSRLRIPGSSVSVSNPSLTATADYRVVRGDTLFGIARTNGISVQALMDLNRFSSGHVIKAGDIIRVPVRSAPVAVQDNPGRTATGGIYDLRWPVTPRDISYMTGQMGVVVEGVHSESVRSLTQGNVISAGPWRKFGRVVIVETAGGYFYMYGGCETLSVNVGDRISPGTEVGRLGINTVSEKPQLFFMVFRSDTPIDPALAPRAGVM